MKVVFKNTFRDVLSFYFYQFLHSLSLYLLSGGFVLAMTVVDAHQLASSQDSTSKKIAIIVGYDLFLILMLVMFWTVMPILSVAIGWFSKKNALLSAEKTLQWDDNSMVVESAYFKTEMKWNAIQKLARTRDYIYIYIAKSSAFVIPRRAFENAQMRDEFFQFCKQRIRQNP